MSELDLDDELGLREGPSSSSPRTGGSSLRGSAAGVGGASVVPSRAARAAAEEEVGYAVSPPLQGGFFVSPRFPCGNPGKVFAVVYAVVLLVLLGVIAHYVQNDKVHVSTMTVDTMSVSGSTDSQSSGGGGGGSGSVVPPLSPSDSQMVKIKRYEAITKDLKMIHGFFTLYATMDDTKLYADVPTSLIHNSFLVTAMFEQGDGVNAMFHLPAVDTDYDVFSIRVSPDLNSVELYKPQLDLRNFDDKSLDDAVKYGAYAGGIKSMPIEGIRTYKDGTDAGYLLDISDWVLRDGLFVFDAGSSSPSIGARFNTTLLKSYPTNTEVVADYFVLLPNPNGGRSVTKQISVHFSISALPANPMTSRVADDRVGYFVTGFSDLGTDSSSSPSSPASRQNSMTLPPSLSSSQSQSHSHSLPQQRQQPSKSFKDNVQGRKTDHIDKPVSVVNRWRLEKSVKGAAPSPPIKPITYYLDPSIPEKWRPYIKAGVENWKPAFEKLGFVDAIQAVLPTDPARWPSDYAAGDIRFSTISWAIDVQSTFALGPSVVDPRTGEILNADIVFTHGWVYAYLSQFDSMAPNLAAVDQVLASSSHSTSHTPSFTPLSKGKLSKLKAATRKSSSFHHRNCQQERLKDPFAPVSSLFLQHSRQQHAQLQTNMDDIIGAALTDVTMHEVGHTLGLRHNFKASTAIPFDKLSDASYINEHGLTSSVMDYLPAAILSQSNAAAYFTPKIGAYDMWAIEYGYIPLMNETMGVQHPTLKEIASRTDRQELVFATDEDSPDQSGEDPFTNYFDLSSDPLAFWEDRLSLVTSLQSNIVDRSVQNGDAWTILLPYMQVCWSLTRTAGLYAAKYLGGSALSKAHKGDANGPAVPVAPISRDEQTKALSLIFRILTDDSLFAKPEHAQYLVGRQGVCSGISQDCFGYTTIDIQQKMISVRSQILETLFDVSRLQRIKSQFWAASSQPLSPVTSSLQSESPRLAVNMDTSIPLEEIFFNTTTIVFGASLHLCPDPSFPTSDCVRGFSSALVSALNLRSLWPLQHMWIAKVTELANRGVNDEVTAVAQAVKIDIQNVIQSALASIDTQFTGVARLHAIALNKSLDIQPQPVIISAV